ncbi:hypothetical protein D650_28235 [Mannheimia haemolytica USDA-ARS-USMARC-183]|nr:hypothetical protein D650_28235 [Mannheimia haemolytica USDA-ARS-USMARC-183]ASW16726.1 hypothetical protein D648_26295 [Mannheimia haemolytica USDA-ARS-USMARC-185]ASW16791.1 hypothetical protein B824_25930 [Mannheimia haemolytica USDA-ARS-USMARC-184]ASW37118.1 hypothetical protein CKG23_10985 [Mannheimia haemolytica]ASW66946.1 hypothetical protein CKG22_11315 [Mannheimia haemolytica]
MRHKCYKRLIITHKIVSNFVRSYGAVGKANVQNAMRFVAKSFANCNYILSVKVRVITSICCSLVKELKRTA